ncbi:ketosteroid isomerase [Flavobacterium rivuli WB 3.3-2 = DSM 21788]|uniref:Ketosteroid isomerase n=1 Tax=Flavobacterium rivuli WB 3.3-2 = DSM 21788 TaxID=1121895 RepID=A0A0A2M7J5_9FLAO|nr:hypothetical protein [Flavobacterium rivuli]KGO87601.1 ketosteroid isomerase [Flavobacterium rivuli WB 3.3-2 = DSM 21788]
MNSDYKDIITKAYIGFNSRNIDAVLLLMDSNVRWPKAFEGDYVTGHEAVREYWTKQWSEINPKVEPASITQRADGKIEVEVNQLVKDLEGNVLFDGKVNHVYTFENNLISVMDVEEV